MGTGPGWGWVALAAGLLASAPVQAEIFSLEAALANAYETNPRLASERAHLAATDEEVAKANANWRPSLNITGTYGVDRYHDSLGAPTIAGDAPMTGDLNLTENIFRGGQTYAEVRHAIAVVKAGQATLSSVESQVLLQAASAYLDVVRDTDFLHLQQDNVRYLENALSANQTRLSAGAVTRTDVAQSQARLEGARADLLSAQARLAASLASFQQVIGRPAATLEDRPPTPGLPKSSDEAAELAAKQNYDVLAAMANETAADYAIDDAVGALLPHASVTARYSYDHDQHGLDILGAKQTENSVGVFGNVTIPIYQGGAEEASVRQAKAQHHQAEYDIGTARDAARQDALASWSAYQAALSSIAAQEAQVKADQEALDDVSQEQRAGERTVIEVLNEQQELLGAQQALATARHDAVVAAYRVLNAAGLLTASQRHLPTRIYDPTIHYNEDVGKWIGFGD